MSNNPKYKNINYGLMVVAGGMVYFGVQAIFGFQSLLAEGIKVGASLVSGVVIGDAVGYTLYKYSVLLSINRSEEVKIFIPGQEVLQEEYLSEDTKDNDVQEGKGGLHDIAEEDADISSDSRMASAAEEVKKNVRDIPPSTPLDARIEVDKEKKGNNKGR